MAEKKKTAKPATTKATEPKAAKTPPPKPKAKGRKG